MKGGGGGGGVGGGGGGGGGKRRWKVLVIGVLVLVILSMLVPLAFLLGLHNGFHSPGFVTVQPASSFESFTRINATKHTQRDVSERVDEVLQKINPVLPKKSDMNVGSRDMNRTSGSVSKKRGLPVSPTVVANPSPANKTKTEATYKGVQRTIASADESWRTCEMKYGSYCLWREENKEPMKDAKVKQMKDQLFVARAYYPSIAKMPSQDKLTRDMKQNIQEFERILIVSSQDADLPPQVEKKLQKMEAVIAKAKSFPVDCNNVDKKLRQILDLTEDETSFHMKQSVFLYQLAVHTMPKSLHCLSMRLTVEHFKSASLEDPISERFSDPSLLHFVIISDNILASSVVINSTVLHARDSKNLVFHVLTDEQNYFAMKQWFVRNPCKQSTIQVLNIEKLELDDSEMKLSLPAEFRVSQQNRTHYLSLFSQSHYLLPKLFDKLEKVVILDDDVVVQRDLSPLWDLDMEGKVNGAVKSCTVRLGQLKSLKRRGSFDTNACLWMSGLNVVDLARWRELGVSETYQKFYKEMSGGDESSEAIALQASLLTFQDQVYALDDKWALSGLGYDHYVNAQAIKNAGVLHYNGNMKPWLEVGIPKYKNYWRKHLNREDRFLSECNVNP
ncbi:PREDICTED: probable galacturonosyltransferase 7 isoform X2 [Camelina sativa]|uniref:Hexosyltransferase n=1 Tax=Camelina sativa TaxID=90675 RepID=A0ABM0Z1L7_CAMSA|nr:PREDICTED: probable galacturonosyltransferase 7 isoform X2 [Camelina sativa]